MKLFGGALWRRSTVAAMSVLVLAAAWWGTYDTPFDPRDPSNAEDARNFIRTDVNLSNQRPAWAPNDSVTLCQAGSNNCALYYYAPLTITWAKARDTNSRERPPESWLERVFKWLLGEGQDPGPLNEIWIGEGDGSGLFGSCVSVAHSRLTFYIDGFWRHGYVNGDYAGSAFIGRQVVVQEQEVPVDQCGLVSGV